MSKSKKCETCDAELTRQEIDYNDGTRCYFCIKTTYEDMAKIMKARGRNLEIPKPEFFGRVPKKAEKSNIDSLPQTHKFVDFGPEERAEFFSKYGFDPQPPVPPTVILAMGENEDTYIKISLGAPAAIDNEEILDRLEELAVATLDTICQIATFGPMNPRATLEKLGRKSQQNPPNPFG